MNHKKAGRLFLFIICVHFITVLAIAFIPGIRSYITGAVNLLLGQGLLFVPTGLYTIYLLVRKQTTLSQMYEFHRIKISTVFMLILYAMLLLPVTMVINLFSLLFTDNTMVSASEMILEYNWAAVLIAIGVLGPICEELVFRGAIFGGMKKTISVRGAVIMSGLAFGLMHMNYNQALYAFPLGVFMALAVEATGSLWGSIVIHMTVNLEQTATMLLVNKIMPGFYSDPDNISLSTEQIYMALAVYMIIALITTVLACVVLIWISKHEGRAQRLKVAVFGAGDCDKPHRIKDVVTMPMIIATALAIAYMTFELICEKLM